MRPLIKKTDLTAPKVISIARVLSYAEPIAFPDVNIVASLA